MGDRAPEFHAVDTHGQPISLERLRGKQVVLYFYPKAFTPFCTAEARRFRDNHAELNALGAEVVGVSVDEHGTQCEFAAKHRLRFPLIADEDKAISRAYGVLWPGLPLDKRVTFVIDEDCVIRAVFRHEVQISKHLDEVLRYLQKRASHDA